MLVFVHTMDQYQLVETMVGGAGHRPVSAANNTGVVKRVAVEKIASGRRREALCRGFFFSIIVNIADKCRSGNARRQGGRIHELRLSCAIFSGSPLSAKIVHLREQLNDCVSIEQRIGVLDPPGCGKENVTIQPGDSMTTAWKCLQGYIEQALLLPQHRAVAQLN